MNAGQRVDVVKRRPVGFLLGTAAVLTTPSLVTRRIECLRRPKLAGTALEPYSYCRQWTSVLPTAYEKFPDASIITTVVRRHRF